MTSTMNSHRSPASDTLKLLIAFRDHPVVDINLIQQPILIGDGLNHNPTSNHKVHVVSIELNGIQTYHSNY